MDMMRIRRQPIQAANEPQLRSGANLSNMKLGSERHSDHRFGQFAQNTSHLIRQLGAVGLIALLTMVGMLGFHTIAQATWQDPNQQPGGDDPPKDDSKEGDENKTEKKEAKKPAPIKEVNNLKELELPDPEFKELHRGTRSHRKPLPELLLSKRLDRPEPSKEETRKFDEFKKTQGATPIKPEDMELIEKVVKNQVYSLTDKDWHNPQSAGRKNRDLIEPILLNPNGVNEKFFSIYKDFLIRYLPNCLDNNLWARVNAMKLIALMRDEKNIRLLVQQINDPKQHEGVKFLAIEGIEMLGKDKKITDVQLESLAVGTLLDLLEKRDQIEPYTRQAAVRALGAIGRPTRVEIQKDVKVAIALLKILRDPNIRRWDRSEALVALSNLSIPSSLDYNFQYAAYEIAQFVADAGIAALKNPAIDDLHTHLFLVDASYALVAEKKPDRRSMEKRATVHTLAAKNGDPAYVKSLGDQISKLTVSALKVYRSGQKLPDEVDKRVLQISKGLESEDFKTKVNAFVEFLKNKPPRDKKLTPQTEELGPPPALVGPSAPVKKEAEEEKGKSDPASGATASQPGSGP